jgi:hypothetical protein
VQYLRTFVLIGSVCGLEFCVVSCRCFFRVKHRLSLRTVVHQLSSVQTMALLRNSRVESVILSGVFKKTASSQSVFKRVGLVPQLSISTRQRTSSREDETRERSQSVTSFYFQSAIDQAAAKVRDIFLPSSKMSASFLSKPELSGLSHRFCFCFQLVGLCTLVPCTLAASQTAWKITRISHWVTFVPPSGFRQWFRRGMQCFTTWCHVQSIMIRKCFVMLWIESRLAEFCGFVHVNWH